MHVYYAIASVLVVYVPLLHVCVALLSQAWQLFLYFIALMIMQNNVFLVHVHGFSMPSTITSICSSSNVFPGCNMISSISIVLAGPDWLDCHMLKMDFASYMPCVSLGPRQVVCMYNHTVEAHSCVDNSEIHL